MFYLTKISFLIYSALIFNQPPGMNSNLFQIYSIQRKRRRWWWWWAAGQSWEAFYEEERDWLRSQGRAYGQGRFWFAVARACWARKTDAEAEKAQTPRPWRRCMLLEPTAIFMSLSSLSHLFLGWIKIYIRTKTCTPSGSREKRNPGSDFDLTEKSSPFLSLHN